MSSAESFDRDKPDVNPAEKIGPKNVSVPPARPAVGPQRVQPDDASFETDFADLAARFAAKSGGGLSPELSADLALEIVLNEIVEQACLATGATGSAIVLRRDSEMICRATSGSTSPDLGSRLDMSGGLSGECVRTLRTVRSDDALMDKRADVEASRRLGVRSVMVMPLLRGGELVGAFELFSARANAFGDRDERTLEALAVRTLNNLARASQAVVPTPTKSPGNPAQIDANSIAAGAPTMFQPSSEKLFTEHEPNELEPERMASELKTLDQESAIRNLILAANSAAPFEEPSSSEEAVENLAGGGPPDDSWWKRDFTTLALTAAVLLCTLLLGVVVGKHFQIRQRAARAHSAPTVAAATAPQSSATPVAGQPASETTTATTPAQAAVSPTNGITIRPAGRSDPSAVPPGGMRIYDNGKEVFRLTPAPIAPEEKNEKGKVVQAVSIEPEQVMQLPPEAAEGNLVRRVEPQYPEQARAQKIQGAVVLDVHIGASGAVEDMQVVSGDALLAQASTDAVKQWRFKPRTQNGHPVQMQTQVTLNFRLPQ
jgi:TonB family protein